MDRFELHPGRAALQPYDEGSNLMDLDLLAVFEAVARTRSYSQAARELRLPKSSVSRAVSRLEAQLGLQLFIRTTRRVEPTAAALQLQERVAAPLGTLRQALAALPEAQEQPSGDLRITAPVDLGQALVAEAVARYTARHPAVRVELQLTSRVVDLVAERVDLALRVAPGLRDSTLVVRRLAPMTLALYASPVYLARRGNPRSEAELGGHEQVAFSGLPRREQRAARVRADDLLFVRDALRAGAGVGFLPTFLAAPELAAGTLVRVLPRLERAAGHLYVVTPAARHVPAKVTAFRALLVELLQTQPLAAA